jgi:hypothetical protein
VGPSEKTEFVSEILDRIVAPHRRVLDSARVASGDSETPAGPALGLR